MPTLPLAARRLRRLWRSRIHEVSVRATARNVVSLRTEVRRLMLRDDPPRRGRGIGNSRGPLILELRSCVPSCIQKGVRIAFAAGLLACFGLQAVCASSTPAPAALTVQRSTRVFPHRFNVHPDGATVAANQTQRFEVTDAQGKTVAVHWNISGLGCSGRACGTIDDGSLSNAVYTSTPGGGYSGGCSGFESKLLRVNADRTCTCRQDWRKS